MKKILSSALILAMVSSVGTMCFAKSDMGRLGENTEIVKVTSVDRNNGGDVQIEVIAPNNVSEDRIMKRLDDIEKKIKGSKLSRFWSRVKSAVGNVCIFISGMLTTVILGGMVISAVAVLRPEEVKVTDIESLSE